MKDNRSLNSSTQSVVSPPTSTLKQLKEIAALFHSGSCSNEVRRIARAVCLTVGLRGKLTGSVISSFLDRALLPGSEAHTRLSCFVKTNEHHMEVDTASSSSQAPPKYFKHLHAEVELYCYLIVLLFLIDQKKYNEAKICSVFTIGRLKSVNRRTLAVIAAKLNVYYYLRYEKPDDLAEIRSTLLPLHQLATLKNEELAEISSSQIHHSSTQYSDGINLGDKSRESRHRWTAPEDLVLISAWLNTSKDPIVGNDKKSGAFCERIASYYAASEEVVGKERRGLNQCKMRWKRINESVNKFVGCYRHASSRRRSGQSDDDVLSMAHELYKNDQKGAFILEHAWRKLMHEQKWCSSSTGTDSSKRTKLGEGGQYSSSSNKGAQVEEEACPRLQGVKSAKRKGKKRVTRSDSEGTGLLE